MEVYDEMAEYYDLIYGDQIDTDYYLLEAKNARGSVLEIGCGTGRILLKLLEAGIEACGIDVSENRLNVLKRKAEESKLEAKVFKANMLDFSFKEKFQLIIVPYRTFLHLKNKEERKKALLNFKKHLEEGGRLILHVYNPSKKDVEMTEEFHHYETEELESPEGMKYSLDWHLQYEPDDMLAHYKVVLNVKHGKSFTYNMDIYFTSMKEIRDLLKECGYKNTRAYCGFDYERFYGTCGEVVWVAEI